MRNLYSAKHCTERPLWFGTIHATRPGSFMDTPAINRLMSERMLKFAKQSKVT